MWRQPVWYQSVRRQAVWCQCVCVVSICMMSSCVMSTCVMSICVMSICVMSSCVMSSCVMSICVMSSCATSIFAMSICVVSICVMSSCVMSICVISICVMSTCVMSICVMSSCVTSIFVMSICVLSICVMSSCVMSICVMSIGAMSSCVMSVCVRVMSICVASVCVMSTCVMSICVISICVMSTCVMSICVMSSCATSIFVMSICAMSSCVMSVCVCVMSICVVSVCVMSICVMPTCVHSYPKSNLHTARRQTRMPARHPKFSHLLMAQLPQTQFTHSKAPNPHASKTSTQNFRTSYWHSYPGRNLHTARHQTRTPARHPHKLFAPPIGAATPNAIYTQRAAKPACQEDINTQRQRQSAGAQTTPKRTSDPLQTRQVPRLPRKSSGRAAETKRRQSVHQIPCRCSKFRAAETKRRQSVRQTHCRCSNPRLPRKSSGKTAEIKRRQSEHQIHCGCSKFHACHAKSSDRAAETKRRQSVLTASRGSTSPWSKARVVTWYWLSIHSATRSPGPNGARTKKRRCLRAPGRGVPGFLAGPALVFCCCFSSMIQILSFVIFTRMSHVSQCTKGSAPIRESCTDFSPFINRWWTNRTRLGWQLAAVRLPPGPGRESWRGKQTKAQYTQRPGDLLQMALEQKKERTGPGYMNQLACEQKKSSSKKTTPKRTSDPLADAPSPAKAAAERRRPNAEAYIRRLPRKSSSRAARPNFFFARRPIGSCNLVLFIHHRLMRGEKSVHNSRIGAKPFLHCETWDILVKIKTNNRGHPSATAGHTCP